MSSPVTNPSSNPGTEWVPSTGGYHPAGRHLVALIIGACSSSRAWACSSAGGPRHHVCVARDSAGYLSLTMPVLSSSSPAITAGDTVVAARPDVPSWVFDRLQVDVRVTARPLASGKDVFLGIAPASSLSAYLGGVAHDQVIGITDPRADGQRTAVLRSTPGAGRATAPTSQTFWTASATGAGQQQLTWRVTGGQWSAVIMNADGSSGVAVSSTIGVRAGFLLPLALLMVGLGC